MQKFYERHAQRVDHEIWLNNLLQPKYSEKSFEDFLKSVWKPLFWHSIFMLITLLIVMGGIREGIEKVSRYMMPILLILMLFLVINSLMLDKEQEGVRFLLMGQPEKLHPYSILEALGHAFFTLSLGMGAMMTYGSYMSESDSAVRDSIWVTGVDTLIALLACLMIFPIIFAYNMNPTSGSIGILFTTLPLELKKLPIGSLLSVLFYILVFLAAITSAISLLEVVTSYFADDRGWGRRKAVLIAGGLVFLCGIPSAFSGSFLKNADNIASRFMLPIGGFFIAVYAGYKMDKNFLRDEFIKSGFTDRSFNIFYFVIRYISPTLVLAVFIHGLTG